MCELTEFLVLLRRVLHQLQERNCLRRSGTPFADGVPLAARHIREVENVSHGLHIEVLAGVGARGDTQAMKVIHLNRYF